MLRSRRLILPLTLDQSTNQRGCDGDETISHHSLATDNVLQLGPYEDFIEGKTVPSDISVSDLICLHDVPHT